MLFVTVEGFGAEDAGIASWTVGVTFAEGPEEFGEEFIGSLWTEREGGKVVSKEMAADGENIDDVERIVGF